MTTRLILVRHAKPDYSFPDDPPLSSEGKSIHRKITEAFKDQGFVPDFIYSSPLIRAQETAEIMADAFGLKIKTEEVIAGLDLEVILETLQKCKEGKTTLFVGHAPTLRELAARLSKFDVPFSIQKSQMFILDFDGKVAKENNVDFSLF